MTIKKLLIVDDEKNIRIGLKTMIEREFPDHYHIRLAIHGVDALAQYESEQADIVITDIRMPVMDGLELIKQVMKQPEEKRKPVFIILSGYDEFTYAKAAIEYQVRDYILKPIRRDELFESLRKSENFLQAQAELARKTAEGDKYREQVRMSRLKEWLSQGELMDGQEEGARLDLDIPFEAITLPCHVAILSYKSENGEALNRDELEPLAWSLLGQLGGTIAASFMDSVGRLVLIGDRAAQFHELLRQTGGKELEGLRLGLSTEAARYEDLRSCYKQAEEALHYSFLYPGSRLLLYQDIRASQRRMHPMPDENIRKLGNMLGTEREREIQALLKAIFRIEELADIDINYLRQVGKRMNEQVLDEVFRLYGEASIDVLKLYRRVGSMDNFRSFHDYYRSLEHLLYSVNEYVRGIRAAYNEHAEINAAIAYMETNYVRPLNMAVVSNYVGLNYSYFSEAFKAQTGESFVLYLKKLRIRKGKMLLEGTNDKMQDIGSALGFESSKQFTRVFKELEGISPQEYRLKVRAAASLGE
ncbi:response regulator [Paenibacillus sp. KS-LC4]|uniref:response regulator n=1 Tax=Paenibacillus sp. KS-LC4 TaxID=2979727 RepID=UPI0030D3EF62